MSRQAIITKYIGPTNARGSRVRASCDASAISWPWDYALSAEENYVAAALALAKKLGWGDRWERGGIGSGYVFVSVDKEDTDEGYVPSKVPAKSKRVDDSVTAADATVAVEALDAVPVDVKP